MITLSEARLIRVEMEERAREYSDEKALSLPHMFPKWSADHFYETGERVRYGEFLYKCLTTHTSQSTWIPSDSPSLWVRVDNPAEEWPEWIQPTGSTDSYQKFSKVSHLGRHWISDYDANIWEPGVFGWSEAS